MSAATPAVHVDTPLPAVVLQHFPSDGVFAPPPQVAETDDIMSDIEINNIKIF